MLRSVSRSILVDAPAEAVFELLADPAQHARLDGSGTVRAPLGGPARLSRGARFRMRMHLGVPYVIANTVVEFEEGRRITWRHFGRHVWRYELQPVEGRGTRVVETFDWSGAVAPRLLELARVPRRNAVSMERTLLRLKSLVEGGRTPAPVEGGAPA